MIGKNISLDVVSIEMFVITSRCRYSFSCLIHLCLLQCQCQSKFYKKFHRYLENRCYWTFSKLLSMPFFAIDVYNSLAIYMKTMCILLDSINRMNYTVKRRKKMQRIIKRESVKERERYRKKEYKRKSSTADTVVHRHRTRQS